MARQTQLRRMGTRRRDGGYKNRRRTVVRDSTHAVSRSYARANRSLVARNTGASIVRCPGYGPPSNIEMTHVFGDTYTLTTSAVGTPVSKYYSMNGIWDPDPALGGLSAYWFKQMAQIYDRYTVIGAKAIVEFSTAAGTTTTNVGPWIVGLIADRNTTTLATTAGVLVMSQNSTTKTIGGDYKNQTCTATYSPEISLGKSSGDDSVQGSSSSNPSSGWWVGLSATELGSATATNIFAKVRIEYRVRWSSVIDTTGS